MTPRPNNPSSKTLAAGLGRLIAVQILRGERAPGTNLPPVRTLAGEHEVTVPTIQRVIDRLEATGLVSARRGSGVTVCDPHTSAELSLLPLWFEAYADQPERAAAILADFLELRRVMTTHLVRHRSDRIAEQRASLLLLAQRLLDYRTVEEAAEADLAFSNAVVTASQHFAAIALFHTTESLIREVPHLAEAFFGNRRYHKAVVTKLTGAIAQGNDVNAAALLIDSTLEEWDRKTVSRYRRLLAL